MARLAARPVPFLLAALMIGVTGGVTIGQGQAYAAAVRDITFNNVSGASALNAAPESRGDSDDIKVAPASVGFLPASADQTKLSGWLTRDDGSTVAFGPGGYAISAAGTNAYRVRFPGGPEVTLHKSAEVPAMFIKTTGGLPAIEANKSHRDLNGSVALIGADTQPVYNGVLAEMRGRGNTTWNLPKKPYQIKLGTSTELVADAGKNRTWILLANHIDRSLIRNQIAYGLEGSTLRRAGRSDHSIKGRMIDLYVDGGFRGSYFLTEKVEVGSQRLNITDLDKANEDANPGVDLDETAKVMTNRNDPRFSGLREGRYVTMPNRPRGAEQGGYLLEMDFMPSARNEASYFATRQGVPFTVKAPELANEDQLAYASGHVQDLEDAIFSRTGRNAEGKHFRDYLDVASFANYYVVQEMLANEDAFKSSTYFYMDKGGKLIAGPMWDFDRSIGTGNPGVRPQATDVHVGKPSRPKPQWIKQLLAHTEFREAVQTALTDNVDPAMSALLASGGELDRYANEMRVSAQLNKIRWPAPGSSSTPAEDIAQIRSFLGSRLPALRTQFGPAYVRNVMLPDGVYTIRNGALNVDVNTNSTETGANIQLWTPNQTSAQKFSIERGSDSFYTITNINSGKKLDLQGGQMTPGTNVWQWPSNGDRAQKWTISTLDGVNFTIASAIGTLAFEDPLRDDGLVLDADNAGTRPGTNIQGWGFNGSPAQVFTFDLAGAKMPDLSEGRVYALESALDRTKVVDVQNASRADQANVHLWSSNGSVAQRFTLDYLDNGRYQIRTGTRPDGAVDVAWGGTANGTNVWQWRSNLTPAQQWLVRPTGDGDGSYYVVSAASGLHLDVRNAETRDGTNVWTHSYTGTRAQKFYFTER